MEHLFSHRAWGTSTNGDFRKINVEIFRSESAGCIEIEFPRTKHSGLYSHGARYKTMTADEFLESNQFGPLLGSQKRVLETCR